jgi:programmed cell death 6-interacting protein
MSPNSYFIADTQSAAGVLDHIIKVILPVLGPELSSPQAGGYDMTESFLSALREFLLAEAQECYWQQAVLRKLIFWLF